MIKLFKCNCREQKLDSKILNEVRTTIIYTACQMGYVHVVKSINDIITDLPSLPDKDLENFCSFYGL
jgi:hypothetical protein